MLVSFRSHMTALDGHGSLKRVDFSTGAGIVYSCMLHFHTDMSTDIKVISIYYLTIA